ncbi:hypothetical protein AZE42_00007 [Rhizopogon vesiculosus]|uniref:Uncharacterized protein n=1 Tax=Rhizopogon vesiculosus TaxID=180088 RepID=A0A1J8Q563_9AGAM|nr:hypothetical protein AZE42_00007 [Rhizopogon vesiculosus]
MASRVASSTMNLSTQLESPRLAQDLEDCRKVYLNVLVAFLTLHSITGSTSLAVVTLALMLYTISLHIAAAARAFCQLGVVIFAGLHAIPAVGIFAVASVELAFAVKSPTAAISISILCLLPAIVTVFWYIHASVSVDLSSESPAGVSRSNHIPA